MRVDLKITGAEQVLRNLMAMGDKFARQELRRAAEAGGKVYQRGMSQRAPRDTGTLARNIGLSVRSAPTRFTALIGPAAQAYYGSFVEFGTRFQPAQPFMRITLFADADAMLSEVSRVTEEALKDTIQ